jgi:CrcB protein
MSLPADRGTSVLGYVAAALGGALGALARWGVAQALPHAPGDWPWSTLLVNLVGCLVLGLLIGAVFARHPDSSWLRPFLGTGVLGGFTTYSTFAVDLVQQADASAWRTVAGYLVASVAGGIAAAALGLLCGRALARPRPTVADEISAEERIA